MEDRFAVLDGENIDAQTDPTPENIYPGAAGMGDPSEYAAIYWPWLNVDGTTVVPPCGHIAGIFARVDGERGVHKAPANEAIRGVLSTSAATSQSIQDGLNPAGINVIRTFRQTGIRVWGARTVGGDANGEMKYVSTRRFLNFLRESIDEGTQFVVFEPNNPSLWPRIRRSVSDFLLGQWRAGALFGATPQQAFFVRCDEETNPPDVREAGQVVTEIGVAITKPAEFVIFRIQQTTGG
jgi:phage tail sheath protein FI